MTHRDWICDDTFDALSRVKDIDLPTLALCGDEDNLTPVKYHEFLRDQMPNCTMEMIHQAGHWTFLEQPEAFNGVVSAFLDHLPG